MAQSATTTRGGNVRRPVTAVVAGLLGVLLLGSGTTAVAASEQTAMTLVAAPADAVTPTR
jgi:hypothetical protein